MNQKTITMNKTKKHISFFVNREQNILIETLKLYNLKMNKRDDVHSVIMDAIAKRVEAIEKSGAVAKNQQNLFDK